MKSIARKFRKTAVLGSLVLAGWIGASIYSAAALDTKPTDGTAGKKELEALLRSRAETAHKALDQEKRKMESGRSTLDWVCLFAQRAVAADLEASVTSQDRLAARTKHFNLMKELEEENGLVDAESSAHYRRLNAEVELV